MKFLHKFCFVYMDDIVVFSKSLLEHLQHLKLVSDKLWNYHLKIQLDKTLSFLGHIITQVGINPNPDKIDVIVKYPIFPRTQKQVKSFLGITNYYRKFIKDYAIIAKPLLTYLKKKEKLIVKMKSM